jgi:hypothetical protein
MMSPIGTQSQLLRCGDTSEVAVAKPLQFPSLVVCFVVMAAFVRIEESFKKQKQQDLLDRIAIEV